jgi:hypothetical protein
MRPTNRCRLIRSWYHGESGNYSGVHHIDPWRISADREELWEERQERAAVSEIECGCE